MKILTTKRLQLREFKGGDAEEIYLLNSDPEVLKHTGDKAFQSVEAAAEFLEGYGDYKLNGMGRWAVMRKEDGAFLGWCGLKKHPSGMVDLGFRFHRRYWNEGYATEAAMACLEYGFIELGLKEIVGRVAEANKASIRVLEKTGMKYWKRDECDGIKDALYYRIP